MQIGNPVGHLTTRIRKVNWYDENGLKNRFPSLKTGETIHMSIQDIYTQLTPIFHDVFDDDDIVLSPELSAHDVDDWDSLTHIRLIVAVEKELDIKFSASEISDLENVGHFAELINEKIKS